MLWVAGYTTHGKNSISTSYCYHSQVYISPFLTNSISQPFWTTCSSLNNLWNHLCDLVLCSAFLEDSPIPYFPPTLSGCFSKRPPKTSQAGLGALQQMSQGSLSEELITHTCLLLPETKMTVLSSSGKYSLLGQVFADIPRSAFHWDLYTGIFLCVIMP